jgi:hypothetical protein
MSTLVLPQDVVDDIIDQLHLHVDIPTLRTCALVHSSWKPVAQRHLRGYPRLIRDKDACMRFVDFYDPDNEDVPPVKAISFSLDPYQIEPLIMVAVFECASEATKLTFRSSTWRTAISLPVLWIPSTFSKLDTIEITDVVITYDGRAPFMPIVHQVLGSQYLQGLKTVRLLSVATLAFSLDVTSFHSPELALETIELDSYLLIGELFAWLSRTKTTGSLETVSLVLNYSIEIEAITWWLLECHSLRRLKLVITPRLGESQFDFQRYRLTSNRALARLDISVHVGAEQVVLRLLSFAELPALRTVNIVLGYDPPTTSYVCIRAERPIPWRPLALVHRIRISFDSAVKIVAQLGLVHGYFELPPGSDVVMLDLGHVREVDLPPPIPSIMDDHFDYDDKVPEDEDDDYLD